jgi:transposase
LLRTIDNAVPADLEIHIVLDHDATHQHPKVKAWLAARPCWHLHFIPTYSSWLNLVERFFAHISAKAIRRGSFSSVRDLVAKIDPFVTHDHQTCRPFVWTARADSILAKLQRLCSRINRTEH